MIRFYQVAAVTVTLVGCTSSAMISELTEDEVTVQAAYADQMQVRAEADRGCAIHGRTAIPVSERCLDSGCTRQSFRFACKGAFDYAGRPSPVWLGMSVDDVANHLYSDSPGAPEVVITRIFADGPARKAGLEVGDVIRSVNGVRVRSALALVDLKDRIGVGERVALAVRRGDRDLRLSLTAERGPGPGAPMAQGAGRP